MNDQALKQIRNAIFLLCIGISITTSGQAWEFEQNVTIEGTLRRAERECTTIHASGNEETRVERSVVLVTDTPLVFSRVVSLGDRQIASLDTPYPHITVRLPKEFTPLIGKRVQCCGNFRRSSDRFNEGIELNVDTALDCERPTLKTLFYDPSEVEVSGLLHKTIYPGPPEYSSVEMGDRPEEVTILTLTEPIDVEAEKDDEFNEREKGVRELQVVFSDPMPSEDQMKREVVLKGTLFHAHTGHHHRRVLIMVNSWNVK